LEITVAPVVVMPDIDSNNESIKLIPLKLNGIEPASDRTTQNRAMITKPSFWESSLFTFLVKNNPITPVAETIISVVVKRCRAPSS
jgi:hypothetical protein